MATTTKEKVPVDHSAISGPKKAEEPFIATVAKTLENAGINIEIPKPIVPAGGGLLSTIKRGREFAPPRILLYGTEGVGKSTFASKAPQNIFCQTEDGLGQIECDKFPLSKTFIECRDQLKALANEKHDYQTVSLDSADWLERLIWDNVCRRANKRNIQEIGYAKGFEFALDEWRETLGLLEQCHQRNMAVILIAHAKIDKFEDPENPAYDRYSPRLHKHAQAMIVEWVDAVLFATRKRSTKMVEGKGLEERPIGIPVGANGGERIIRTVESPSCSAKNRYELPPEIPLSWDSFAEGLGKWMTKNS
jgi:hypothetical protein